MEDLALKFHLLDGILDHVVDVEVVLALSSPRAAQVDIEPHRLDLQGRDVACGACKGLSRARSRISKADSLVGVAAS